MVESFDEYFEKRGAVGLFCVINPAGSRFEELLTDLLISRGTLNARLQEGQELGLVSKEIVEGEMDVVKLWVPTERGTEVCEELKARQITRRFEEYREGVREFEREKDAFVKYVERKDDAEWNGLEPVAYPLDEEHEQLRSDNE